MVETRMSNPACWVMRVEGSHSWVRSGRPRGSVWQEPAICDVNLLDYVRNFFPIKSSVCKLRSGINCRFCACNIPIKEQQRVRPVRNKRRSTRKTFETRADNLSSAHAEHNETGSNFFADYDNDDDLSSAPAACSVSNDDWKVLAFSRSLRMCFCSCMTRHDRVLRRLVEHGTDASV